MMILLFADFLLFFPHGCTGKITFNVEDEPVANYSELIGARNRSVLKNAG